MSFLIKGIFGEWFTKFVQFRGNSSYGDFKVIKFESNIKIEVAPFSIGLGQIFAQDLGITRKRWVVILQNLKVSKLFFKVSISYIKSYEKHDEDVAKPVRPTILELCPNFVQKWDPVLQKIVPPQFWQRFWIGVVIGKYRYLPLSISIDILFSGIDIYIDTECRVSYGFSIGIEIYTRVHYPRFTCEWSRKNLWFYILSLNGE